MGLFLFLVSIAWDTLAFSKVRVGRFLKLSQLFVSALTSPVQWGAARAVIIRNLSGASAGGAIVSLKRNRARSDDVSSNHCIFELQASRLAISCASSSTSPVSFRIKSKNWSGAFRSALAMLWETRNARSLCAKLDNSCALITHNARVFHSRSACNSCSPSNKAFSSLHGSMVTWFSVVVNIRSSSLLC